VLLKDKGGAARGGGQYDHSEQRSHTCRGKRGEKKGIIGGTIPKLLLATSFVQE